MKNITVEQSRLNKALVRFEKLKPLDGRGNLNQSSVVVSNDSEILNNIQELIYEKMQAHTPSFDINNPPSFKTNYDEAMEFTHLLESYVDFVSNPRVRDSIRSVEDLKKDREFVLIEYLVSARARQENDICDVSVRPNPLKVIMAKAERPYIKVSLEQQFDILMDVALGLWHLSQYLKDADSQHGKHNSNSTSKKPYEICEDSVREVLLLARIDIANIDLNDFFSNDINKYERYESLKTNFVNYKEPNDNTSLQRLNLEVHEIYSHGQQFYQAPRIKYLNNFIKRQETLRLLNKSVEDPDYAENKKSQSSKYKEVKTIFDVDNASDYSVYVDRVLYDLVERCFDRDDVKTLVEVNPRLFAFRKACENLKQSSEMQIMTSQTIKFLRDQVSGHSDVTDESRVLKTLSGVVLDRKYARKMFKNLLNRRDDVEVAHLAVAAAQLKEPNPVIRPNPNTISPQVRFSPKLHQRKVSTPPKNKASEESYVDGKKATVEHHRRENKLDLFQQQMQLADMMLRLFDQPLCSINGHNCSIMEWAALDKGNKSLQFRIERLQKAMIDIKVKLAAGDSELLESNLSDMGDNEYQSKVTDRLRKIKDRDVAKLQDELNQALNSLVNNVYKDSPRVVDQVIIAAAQTQSLIQARYGLEDFTRTLVRDEVVNKVVSNNGGFSGWVQGCVESLCFDNICLQANIFFDFNSDRTALENVKSVLTSNNQVVVDSLRSFKKVVEASQAAENFQVFEYDNISSGKKDLIDRVTHEESLSHFYRFAKNTFDIFAGLFAPISVYFYRKSEKDSDTYDSAIFYDNGKPEKIDRQHMLQRETVSTILDLEYEQEYNILKRSLDLLNALNKHGTPGVPDSLIESLEKSVDIKGDQRVCLAKFKLLAIQRAFKSLEKYSPIDEDHPNAEFMREFKEMNPKFFDDSVYSGLLRNNENDIVDMEKFIANANFKLAELNVNNYQFDSNDLYTSLYEQVNSAVEKIKTEDHYEITAVEILKYVLSAPQMLQRIKLGVATLPHVVTFSYEMSEHYKNLFGFLKFVTKAVHATDAYKKLDTMSSFGSAMRYYIFEQTEFGKDLSMIDKFVENFRQQPARKVEQPSSRPSRAVSLFSTVQGVVSRFTGYGSSDDTESNQPAPEDDEIKYEEDTGFFFEKLQSDYSQMTYNLGKETKKALVLLNTDHSKDKVIADLEAVLESNKKIMQLSSDTYMKNIFIKLKSGQQLNQKEEHQYKRFKDMRLHVVTQVQEILLSLYQKMVEDNGSEIRLHGEEFNLLMLLRYANNSLMSQTKNIQKAMDGDALLSSGANQKTSDRGVTSNSAIHKIIDIKGEGIRAGYADNSAGAAVSAFQSFVKDLEKAHKNQSHGNNRPR